MTTNSRDFRFADSFYLKPGNADNWRTTHGQMFPRKNMFSTGTEGNNRRPHGASYTVLRSRTVPKETTRMRVMTVNDRKNCRFAKGCVRLVMEELTACRARKGS